MYEVWLGFEAKIGIRCKEKWRCRIPRICLCLQGGMFVLNVGNHIPGRPVWSSGQSSWLQIQKSGFDSRHYRIFWQVVGLERDPFSLVSTTEKPLGRNSSGFGLENRKYGRRNPSLWPRCTLYTQKLALTSTARGGRSVGIFRSRTQTTEFSFNHVPDYMVSTEHRKVSPHHCENVTPHANLLLFCDLDDPPSKIRFRGSQRE
jgi:hypothetical protein